MKAEIYYPPPLQHMLYLPTHSTPLHEICSSYVSPPSDPFKHSLLSQYCWGRWKPTTTPMAAAALKKHCFLGHLLSSLLVGAQFSSCSLSEWYHYRPLSWVASGCHRQVLCPSEHIIYIRVEGVGGWSGALSHTSITLNMLFLKIKIIMKILTDIYSCDAMKQILSGVNQMLVIRHRNSRQN